MPNIQGTTNAQSRFLRAFRTSPAGPPPADWPAPTLLRRWLRKPAFRTALNSVRDTLRYQADLHLAAAAAQAASAAAADPANADVRNLAGLLRLAHLRQRFPARTGRLNSPATFTHRENIADCQDDVDHLAREQLRHPTDDAVARKLDRAREKLARLKSGEIVPCDEYDDDDKDENDEA